MADGGLSSFDLCVVGAGMVGSAIARHVSTMAHSGYSVCLIGPEEPNTRSSVTGREVFGAHYDSGRITGTLATKSEWAELAYRSMCRYRELETLSGVKFYNPTGCLSVGPKDYLKYRNFHQSYKYSYLDQNELGSKIPYINFDKSDQAVFDPEGGWIDPRKLVSSQIMLAVNHGCDVIRDVVDNIRLIILPGGCEVMELRTGNGRKIFARKVILATNSFSTSRNLLPENCKPKFLASPQTVVFGEVDSGDTNILSKMPSVLYRGRGGGDWYPDYPKNSAGDLGYYLMPPVPYPDGKTYIKIGHSDDILKGYLGHQDISRWHCSGGDPWLVDSLTRLLQTMFNGMKFKSFRSDSCVTMVTETGNPYIDMVHEKLGVAIGGNGHAAKSSDEIGRIAACMMLNVKSDSQIPMETFRLVTEGAGPKSNPNKL